MYMWSIIWSHWTLLKCYFILLHFIWQLFTVSLNMPQCSVVSLSSSIIFYVTQEYFMFSPNHPCVQEERNLCRETSVISDLNIQSVQTFMNYEVRHLMWSVWNNKFLHQSVRVWVLKKLWTFITDRSLKILSISSWIIAILDLFQIKVLVLLEWQRKKIIVK